MPPINTFQDPRFQAIADFLSVAQIDRMQAERERREERERQNRLTTTLVGAGVGALTGGIGFGGAAAVGGKFGAVAIPTFSGAGALAGAQIGAQAGAQFAGGDIAGGFGSIAQGVGQGVQRRQDIQQFGFPATTLDKKEISRLALSLGTTTRQLAAQAKQAGVSVGQFSAQLAQQQDLQRQQDVFEGQMAQQEGASPDAIRAQDPSGQNDFGAGLQVVQAQNDEERLAFQEKQLDQRLSQTELFRGMSETHDLRPAPDGAQQALRYRNAVLSPASGVDPKQRLELLNRIVEDAENQPASLQWVRKQPPDPAEVATKQIEGMQPLLDGLAKMGYTDARLSFSADGKTTVSVTTEKSRDSDITLPSGATMSRTKAVDLYAQYLAARMSAPGPNDTPESMRRNAKADFLDGIILTENLAQELEERLLGKTPQDTTPREAADELKAAVRESPDIESWPPKKVEQHRGDARTVFDFYVSLLEGGRQLDEKQQRELEIAKRILEQ